MNIDNLIGDLVSLSLSDLVKSTGPEAVANQLMPEPVVKFLHVFNYLESETSQKVIPEIMHHKDLNKFTEGQGDEGSIIATLVQMVSPGLQVEVLLQLSKHPCQDETSVLTQVVNLSPENQINAAVAILREPGNRLANLIATDDSQGQMRKTLIEAFMEEEDRIKEQLRRPTTLSE